MRILRRLLVPLLVISVITSLTPSASFATPTTTKTPANKCKTKRGFCKPTTAEAASTLSATAKIFNDRLVVETDSSDWLMIGAQPDSTGNPTPNSWDLSYRWPNAASTSYTTIRIDGTDYIYGIDGTQSEAPNAIDNRTIRSAWKIGDIEVTQTLQIGANPHTGQKDAVIIAYTLRNTSLLPKTVGTRVMIDTEINQNDGFPFRVPGTGPGTGIVSNETEFTGANVPDVVLASATAMTDTQVTASTLKGSGATTPDKLVLADWSNLSSELFDYTVNPATSLTTDSAYAVYWNPKMLAASESRTYVTLYGLGQATVNKTAPLALSVRGPATLGRIWNDYTPNPFDITATISNTGATTTAGTQVTLTLPVGLTLVSGTATRSIGSLPAGQERQVSWKVRAPLQNTAATLNYSVAASATGVAAKTVTRPIALPDLNATGRGPFAVSKDEYRFNPKIHSDVLSARETELWARVYWPTDLSKGKYPLAIFLHGNHGTCGKILGSGVRDDDRSDYTTSGTCPTIGGTKYQVTPNHEGYEYLGDQLASWGYIVVSINANRGITAGAGVAGDGFLTDARGRQVLKHLQLWQSWHATGTADTGIFGAITPGYTTFRGSTFKNKIDFGNVGMMGHSRGGQGVRAAYRIYNEAASLNTWRKAIPGLNIKGIFEIGPTDANNNTNPAFPAPFETPGTAWTVLLPMCDGDVADLQGVRAFDRVLPQSGENPATQKSTYAVWGTNHNYYNTEWQISDSDGCTGPGHTAIFTPGETFGDVRQRQTGLASLMAFFRANVGAYPETAYNLIFNPLTTLPPVASNTPVDRGYSVSPSTSISTVLEDFSKPKGTNVSGAVNESAVVTVDHGKVAGQDADFNGDGVIDRVLDHHDTTQRVGNISWTTAAPGNFFQTNWQAPGSGRDINDHATLDFRIARQISALNAAGATNFSIRLAHGDGTLSDPVQLSAYTSLTGPVGVPLGAFNLQHTLLETARIPLKDFTNAKLAQVRGVRFTFDSTASGAIYVANMQFSRQFEPTPFVHQFVPAGATPFSVPSVPEAQPALQIAAEIEVYSPNGFPIRDAVPVLRIGDQEIFLSRYKDGSTKTLIFSLTADQLAASSDGDPVTLLYGPYSGSQTWLFGPLNKSNLRYGEQLLPTQQAARDLLAALRSQATTTQEQNQIDSALQRLDRTLATGVWRDSTHLESGSADQVFDDAQQVVTSLQALMRSNSSAIPSATVRNFIRTRVVHVLRGLAAQSIDEATAGQPGLDQARDALARGDDAALNNQFVSAVQHYRSAWRQAQRATR